jgi:hypothetical protein
MVGGEVSIHFLVNPTHFSITWVDSDIMGKMVGENNTEEFTQH